MFSAGDFAFELKIYISHQQIYSFFKEIITAKMSMSFVWRIIQFFQLEVICFNWPDLIFLLEGSHI